MVQLNQRLLKQYVIGVLIVIVSCGFATVAGLNGWFEPLERIYYDLWHQMAEKRYPPDQIVIVAVDDQTLLDHKDEPLAFWGPHFATTLEVMKKVGVKMVGVDFIFSVSAESWLQRLGIPGSDISRTYDIALRKQLGTGSVILAGQLAAKSDGEMTMIMPVIDFLYSLPDGPEDVGFSNLYQDDDGVVRKFVKKLLDEQSMPNMTFAALLVKKVLEREQRGKQWASIPDFTPQNIGYAGPPGTFQRISMNKLLADEALSDPDVLGLRDKIVIIASEHSGSSDIHLTPYMQALPFGLEPQMMTGAEIQANIIATILNNRGPQKVPDHLVLAWMFVFVSVASAIFFRLSPFLGFVGLVFLVLGYTGVAYGVFCAGWLLPAANGNVALLVAFVGCLSRRLTKEEKNKAVLQRVFSPYISEIVIERILASGSLPNLGGETLDVTILFSDIRSFTTISENLSPSEVLEMLNTYYSRVCEPITEQGGIIDKFIGDAVMAVFGAPLNHPDHARRSFTAALAMVKIADDFQSWLKERFPDKNLPGFKIGIGIHSGRAVIGNLGSAKRMEYTAIGDTVNIAARLESLSKKLGWTIVASRASIKAAGNGVSWGKTEMVTPLGRIGKLEVMELLELAPAAPDESVS